MIDVIDKASCVGCNACCTICPVNAITMIEDNEGFNYPSVDGKRCVKCGACANVCPVKISKELSHNRHFNSEWVFAGYNKDEHFREVSSSGGIFCLLASSLLDNCGVVVGAAFDESFNVVHKLVDNKDDLFEILGTKYVQSNIVRTYEETREHLINGTKVLYSGTPCQIAGLKAFLSKEYDNLITVSTVCHGVPSPGIWREYINQSYKPTAINFRDKSLGWKSYQIKISEGNKTVCIKKSKEAFMKAYLNDYILRPSCYECLFKNIPYSDIILGDFWGIDKIDPSMDDDHGTSLIILNTDKGIRFFKEIKNSIVCKEFSFEDALKYNPAINQSSPKPDNRDSFFVYYKCHSLRKTVEKFIGVSLFKRIIKRVKNTIKV